MNTQNTQLPVKLHSIEDAADAIGISRPTLYRLIDAGKLHSIKVGRRRLIPDEALRALAQRGA